VSTVRRERVVPSHIASRMRSRRGEGVSAPVIKMVFPGCEGTSDSSWPYENGEMKYSAHQVDMAAASEDKTDAKKLWALSTDLTGANYAL